MQITAAADRNSLNINTTSADVSTANSLMLSNKRRVVNVAEMNREEQQRRLVLRRGNRAC